MAKINSVHLLGDIYEILNEEKTMFAVKVRKHGDKFVYPVVKLTENTEFLKDQIEAGKKIFINGSIKTEKTERVYKCTHCNHLIKKDVSTGYISATSAFLLSCENSDEYENNAVVLGAVYIAPYFKLIPGKTTKIPYSRYVIAANETADTSSYIQVNSFLDIACRDLDKLQLSSQVLVKGIVVSNEVHVKYRCRCCKNQNILKSSTIQINSQDVEYLNLCRA